MRDGRARAGADVRRAADVDDGHACALTVRQRTGAIVEAVRRLDEAGVGVDDLGLRRPTLDDVFLSLTGHAAEERHDDEPTTEEAA